ncbi:unnamed protein product [Linum trigynum]|uniref:Uncharacterized protein n=1 Tax=Linum trigynum TaxID=586398 RepID=A0AAV2GES5_9ROSI
MMRDSKNNDPVQTTLTCQTSTNVLLPKTNNHIIVLKLRESSCLHSDSLLPGRTHKHPMIPNPPSEPKSLSKIPTTHEILSKIKWQTQVLDPKELKTQTMIQASSFYPQRLRWKRQSPFGCQHETKSNPQNQRLGLA